MNNALCGDPKALPGGDIGHSAYPDAVWAAGSLTALTTSNYVIAGVYEVNQDLYSNADRSGFEFGVPQDSGVYLPVQIGYEPKLGPGPLPGHYVAGFGYDPRVQEFLRRVAGEPGVPISAIMAIPSSGHW